MIPVGERGGSVALYRPRANTVFGLVCGDRPSAVVEEEAFRRSPSDS